MSEKQIIIYIDISEFLATRKTTGIQRVIREILLRIFNDTYILNIIYFDNNLKLFKKISNTEVISFLKDVENYQFKISKKIDLFDKKQKNKFFFEIDTVWNSKYSRMDLYKKLKIYGFQIYNFIFDLIPILYPNYLYSESKQNFPKFIESVYKYSDLVFFTSSSSKKDFFKLKKDLNIKRKIDTKILHLGSDYTVFSDDNKHQYKELLSKKYILFVGTIEPRKQQLEVLKAFEKLYIKYPYLNLVFIGKIGWNVQLFTNTITTHPLKDKSIYHLTDISDDVLSLFYQNAFVVTYISKYEGYGLPISESLYYHNITIASKNSSLVEVGKGFVDYIEYNSEEKLIQLISYYMDDSKAYNLRKKNIKENYKNITWNEFYSSLSHNLKSNY